MRVTGVGDCIGAAGVVAADFGFIVPENMDGFFAGAAAIAGAGLAIVAGAAVTGAVLHEMRLCVVGSWQYVAFDSTALAPSARTTVSARRVSWEPSGEGPKLR